MVLTEFDENKVVIGGGRLEVVLGQHQHAVVVLDLGGQNGGDDEG